MAGNEATRLEWWDCDAEKRSLEEVMGAQGCRISMAGFFCRGVFERHGVLIESTGWLVVANGNNQDHTNMS